MKKLLLWAGLVLFAFDAHALFLIGGYGVASVSTLTPLTAEDGATNLTAEDGTTNLTVE